MINTPHKGIERLYRLRVHVHQLPIVAVRPFLATLRWLLSAATALLLLDARPLIRPRAFGPATEMSGRGARPCELTLIDKTTLVAERRELKGVAPSEKPVRGIIYYYDRNYKYSLGLRSFPMRFDF